MGSRFMFKLFVKSILVILVLSLWGSVSPGIAQNTSVNTSTEVIEGDVSLVDEEQRLSSSWSGILDTTTQALSRQGVTNDQLDGFFKEAASIIKEANEQITKLEPQANSLTQQLEEIGEAPKEGEPPEAPEITDSRNELTEQFSQVDAGLKEARLAFVRARQIQKQIAEERHSRFLSAISVRSIEIADPKFWTTLATGFSGFSRSLTLLFNDSFYVFVKKLSESRWKIFALPLLIFIVLFVFNQMRKRLHRIALLDEVSESSTGITNPVAGFLVYCRTGLLPAFLPYALYWIFLELELLTSRLEQFLSSISIALGFYIAAVSLGRVYLFPASEERRIIGLNNEPASWIFKVLVSGLAIALGLSILNITSVVLVAPIEVSVGLSVFFCLVVSISVLSALIVGYRDRRAQNATTHGTRLSGLWRYLTLAVWIACLAILVAIVSGYVAFAEFLAQQLVFGTIVIGSTWLVLRFADFVFSEVIKISSNEETDIQTEIPRTGSPQIMVLFLGIIKLLIYSSACILLLLPWGYRTSDFYQIFNSVFFGFEIGGLSISVSTVLIAFGLFVLGYSITVGMRSWLNNKLLPTTRFDSGVSNSISTVFGYIGFILAAILAISAAGFDLSNLAIVAGALSVGVGFGLQSIVNNFVSGLILLAERPIKAGDWIMTAGGEGTVKRISVRSTEIETFDRSTVIIPNSTLITDTVTNWTHEDTFGRIRIAVGVSYDSDPEQVHELLLTCAKAHRLVLGKPEPIVYFMDFGPDSLNFELRCFMADINYCMSVQSDLRFEILKALREAKIEIPFPQRDIHIRSDVTKE